MLFYVFFIDGMLFYVFFIDGMLFSVFSIDGMLYSVFFFYRRNVVFCFFFYRRNVVFCFFHRRNVVFQILCEQVYLSAFLRGNQAFSKCFEETWRHKFYYWDTFRLSYISSFDTVFPCYTIVMHIQYTYIYKIYLVIHIQFFQYTLLYIFPCYLYVQLLT